MRNMERYTELGKKVATLAGSQATLAEVLELTQQSISGKLTGKIAITLKDLETLSQHYDVPFLYFFSNKDVTPEMARSFREILEGPPELGQMVGKIVKLPREYIRQLQLTIQAVCGTADYHAQLQGKDVELLSAGD